MARPEWLDDPARYTDQDLREAPLIWAMAEAYAEHYTGEFEPLVEARAMMDRDGRLELAIARKVANCMRQDALLGVPLPPTRAQRVAAVIEMPGAAEEPVEQPKLEQVKRQSKATVHYRFIHPSGAKNAKLHLVAFDGEARPYWRTTTHSPWSSRRALRRPVLSALYVHSMCGKSYSSGVFLQLPPEGVELCPGCFPPGEAEG